MGQYKAIVPPFGDEPQQKKERSNVQCLFLSIIRPADFNLFYFVLSANSFISPAFLSTASVILAPPNSLASSSTEACLSNRRMVVMVLPWLADFAISKCESAMAAICGRWVMQMT